MTISAVLIGAPNKTCFQFYTVFMSTQMSRSALFPSRKRRKIGVLYALAPMPLSWLLITVRLMNAV